MALILIVEDSLYQRRLIYKMVKAQGYSTLEASNGQEGLKILTTQTPDCILLDLVMPEVSGLDFLETLHNQGVNIPIIVITADIQISTQKQCLAFGATTIINKPVKKDELYQAIAQILSVK